MTRRKDETIEEYRVRHAEEERRRREDPEYQAKLQDYKQRPDVKAKHAEYERERRKTKQAQAYEREYRRKRYEDPEIKEKKKQYQAEWYRRNKERTKPAKQAWSQANRHKHREYYLDWEKRNPRRALIQRSRSSAKQRGLEHTISETDIQWPTHCPVLGIELCYDRDKKTAHRDDYPSFDRRDGLKGYVPGNVFVISWRANRIKWNCTLAELKAVVYYIEHGI